METITLANAWAWLLAAASALVLLSNAAEKIVQAVKAARAPNVAQDARLDALEEWRKTVDNKLNRDNERLETIEEGTRAPQAAGKIHTDFEKGFIRAEIVAYDDLIREGSMAACKEKGLVRSEGKEYVMKDGDVTLFRFNV